MFYVTFSYIVIFNNNTRIAFAIKLQQQLLFGMEKATYFVYCKKTECSYCLEYSHIKTRVTCNLCLVEQKGNTC